MVLNQIIKTIIDHFLQPVEHYMYTVQSNSHDSIIILRFSSYAVCLFTTEHHRIPQNTTEHHRIPQNSTESHIIYVNKENKYLIRHILLK